MDGQFGNTQYVMPGQIPGQVPPGRIPGQIPPGQIPGQIPSGQIPPRQGLYPPLPLINEPMPERQGEIPLLLCRNLTKCYVANRPALNGINLRIEAGHIVGLLGPNGSGKTTFIKLLNGLLTPTRGEILIRGQKPGEQSRAIVSYLPERTYLEAQNTVKKLVEFFADFYVDFDRERAYRMLEALAIDPSASLKTLSKGTKEKVQLILVMARNAQLYVLDEPIAGVDPAARDFIIRTILANYNPNATILICTHLITDIEQFLDDFVFIRNGQISAQGAVNRVHETLGLSLDQYFREVFAYVS